LSRRITDFAAQEAVMDPSLLLGSRKYLTELDLAFLRDLGYATIPEPSVTALALGGLLIFSARRRC
jgi:hypothetical protein